MSLFHALLADNPPPPEPPSVSMASFNTDGIGHGRVAARQLSLEPASGGVDVARSWSGLFNAHNLGTQNMRLWINSDPAGPTAQYSLNIVVQSDQTGFSGRIGMALFNTGQTASISVYSTLKVLRSRWYHYVITYDGSGSFNGYKLYLNAVEDTTASKFGAGVYTTAGQSANWRFQLGAVVNTGGISFRGRQRGLAIWNRVLTSSEVQNLYDYQLGFNPVVGPGDITTLPWYAAAITGFWPLELNGNCTNNAALNFTSVSNIGFGVYPLGPNYNFLSIFNGIITNSRYVAFPSMFKIGPNIFPIKVRSGTDHITAGKGIDVRLNSSGNMLTTTPVDILTDAMDLRVMCAGITDGADITMFSATYSGGVIQDLFWVKSTDGIIGQVFGSKNSVLGILPVGFGAGLTYGKIIAGYVAGEYLVPWYSGNVGGTSKIGILKRSAGGVWSYIPVYSGATAYGEPALCAVGNNSYFIVARLVGGNDLHRSYSLDDAATWSAFAATNLAPTGECMADMCLMPSGNLVLVWADRTREKASISLANDPLDIIADPTDWNAGSDFFQAYTFGNILGYPQIVVDGHAVALCVSAEFSANRADLYVGYGDIEFS